MKICRPLKGLQLLLVSTFLSSYSSYSAIAQIIPDSNSGSSLGTIVTPNGTTFDIRGGTSVSTNGRTNLFHSFEKLDVRFSEVADFITTPNVTNIFARVRDPSNMPSNINGTLQVTGSNANLFLMNPNGIVFGPNARLNVRGSFVATTADAIEFNSRTFSLTSSVNPSDSLLAINPNALFFNRGNSGRIESRSTADAGREFTGRELFGLRIPDGQSLLLVGNGILLDGGNQTNGAGLIALGGNIELASVAAGKVNLIIDNTLIRVSPLTTDVSRSDVDLVQWAAVNVRGSGGGRIAVQAQNLTMNEGSILLGGISPFQTLSSSASKAGDIEVNVKDVVHLSGLATFTERTTIANSVGISATPDIEGQGGNIRINAKTLQITDGAQIFASTFGKSQAGDITIQAEDVKLDGDRIVSGNSKPAASQIFTRVEPNAEGNGGVLRIQTNQLSLTNGAALNTSTLGLGTAGQIIIEKADMVWVKGFGQTGNPAKIVADTESRGNAGTLTIQTQQLFVQEGGQISAQTTGDGNAGNLEINANQIFVQSGGRISAESKNLAGGKAGTLTIKNAELIRVNGRGSELKFDTRSSRAESDAGSLELFTNRLEVLDGGRISARTTGFADAGRILVIAPEAVLVDGAGSGLFFDSESFGDAQLDGIRVETRYLTIQNQGQMVVDGTGSGATGDIFVAAESIRMVNQGQISATTRTGQGGNVHIKIGSGNLIMGGIDSRGQPFGGGNEIRARAFGFGDGGSVIIEPLSKDSAGAVISTSIFKDNDILAIAEGGTGGRADAERVVAVIGFVPFSNLDTPRSDFTARSQFGVDGNTLLPNDQTEEALPTDFLNSQIAQGCQALRAGAGQSKFVYDGNGGLPSSPHSPLNNTLVEIGLVGRGNNTESQARTSVHVPIQSQPEPIVEAQQWIRHTNGSIELVAQAPVPLPLPLPTSDCGLKGE